MATKLGALTLGNGVNLQPSYYNNGDVTFGWNLMIAQPLIKTVRIEIEPGYEAQACDWIAAAKSHGYQIIATYHKSSVLGSDDPAELITAANWWKVNYDALGGGFIINLMNEWGSHKLTAGAYAGAYNQAIKIVRTVYKVYVIVDIPGWGQEIHTAYSAVKLSTPKITDPNIALSVHIYKDSWNSGTGQFLKPADIDKLINAGKPCIAGEFGSVGTGQCNWSDCVDHAEAKGLTIIGWCWNGDGNGFNMVTPSWNENPQADTLSKSPYFDTIYSKL